MDTWTLLEYAAWAGSALLLGWLTLDAMRIKRDYTEEFLLSSREGEDRVVEEGEL